MLRHGARAVLATNAARLLAWKGTLGASTLLGCGAVRWGRRASEVARGRGTHAGLCSAANAAPALTLPLAAAAAPQAATAGGNAAAAAAVAAVAAAPRGRVGRRKQIEAALRYAEGHGMGPAAAAAAEAGDAEPGLAPAPVLDFAADDLSRVGPADAPPDFVPSVLGGLADVVMDTGADLPADTDCARGGDGGGGAGDDDGALFFCAYASPAAGGLYAPHFEATLRALAPTAVVLYDQSMDLVRQVRREKELLLNARGCLLA